MLNRLRTLASNAGSSDNEQDEVMEDHDQENEDESDHNSDDDDDADGDADPDGDDQNEGDDNEEGDGDADGEGRFRSCHVPYSSLLTFYTRFPTTCGASSLAIKLERT